MEPDLFQRFPLVLAHPDNTAPEHRIGGKTALPSVRTDLEKVPWSMLMAEVEPVVPFGWDPGDGFVLENKIPEAVEDGCAFVDLDAAQEVRPMGSEEVAALVDGPVRELHQEVGRRAPGAAVKLACGAAFVAVDA